MITLYHGSNVSIDTIDLDRCHPDKDFGKGYYLTDIRSQAETMALRRTRIAGEGTPTLTSYEFDDGLLRNPDLNIKVFDSPCEEWALFVLANREASLTGYTHDYDIVVGPIADDGVGTQIRRLSRGFITFDAFLEELKYSKVSIQYFFGTKEAIKYLKKI